MAKNQDKSQGALSRLGMSAKKWAASFLSPAQEIKPNTGLTTGVSPVTIASLLRGNRHEVRVRREVYEKWSYMEGDAIVSAALSILVTAALGGNETSGDLVFIECRPEAKTDKQRQKMVEEISADLTRLFNRVAYQVAYTGATYGDAYARIYSKRGQGVVDLYTDELVRPHLIQPFERGSRTVGFAVYLGQKSFERLDVSQLARMKMPRVQWVPQQGVVEKAMRMAITEDDIDNMPLMPSMAGGSLLFAAEEAYDRLNASLLGLVGQRWMDSIDEQMLQVNLADMTEEQQERFLKSVERMLKTSKDRAEEAIKKGRPVMERLRHIIPVFSEKQLTTISGASGGTSGRVSNITIDDVMMHARLLAGCIGVDLSMLGFADQMSGGLGEGGWFRTSAQVAERARVIRVALEDFFNWIVDIHTMEKYGVVFGPSERPWEIQFYGSISALESERQKTRADAMNSGLLMAQGIQLMKDMGANRKIMELFLTKTMQVDEAEAKVYAEIAELASKQQDGGFGGDDEPGGGGFGGGNDRGDASDGDGGEEVVEDEEDPAMDSAIALAEMMRGMLEAPTFDSAEDELGPEFRGFDGKPHKAIEKLLREKRGHINNVWTREGVGKIGLVYGSSKGGLRHIAEKHPASLRKLADVVARGRVVKLPGSPDKVFVFNDSREPPEITVVALDYMKKKHAWVVTSYDDHKGGFAGKLRKNGVSATGATLDTAGSIGADDKSRRANADST